MIRKLGPGPALQKFGELLSRHLDKGTRPGRDRSDRWTDEGFAGKIPSKRHKKQTVSPRSVSNWRNGVSLPDQIDPILDALFDGSPEQLEERHKLLAAYDDARLEERGVTKKELLKLAKSDPAGAKWVPQGNHLVIEHTSKPSDKRAAADPIRRQLQAAIRSHADELVERAGRLHNNTVWKSVPTAAKKFGALTRLSPEAFLDRLGDAYSLMLQLGRFLETDQRVQKDAAQMHEPLPPDVHGPLADLVRIAAPWLRGFPTIAAMDDQAGKALAQVELLVPALRLVQNARDEKTIGADDAEALAALGESANVEGFLSRKAGARTVASAKNLLLATALLAAVRENGNAELIARALATLASSSDEIEDLSVAFQPDLAYALRSVAEAAKAPQSPNDQTSAIPETDATGIPEDVEAQARELILQGRAPPERWRPHIRELSFFREQFTDVSPLSGLTGLQRLDLQGTQVTDVSPLSGLTGLRRLDLQGTQVKNASSLAGLKDLSIDW